MAAALPYALRAAEDARGRYALEVAASLYRLALTGAPESDRDLRCRLAAGLGEVLAMQGETAAAQARLEQALELTDQGLDKARLLRKLSDVANQQSDFARSVELGLRGLAALGDPVPLEARALTLGALQAAGRQLAHVLAPAWFCRLAPKLDWQTTREAAYLRLRLLCALEVCPTGVPEAIFPWLHLRNLNQLERFPPSTELGLVYGFHGFLLAYRMGFFRAAQRYAARAVEIQETRGDLWAQGMAVAQQGVTALLSSRFSEGEQGLARGCPMLERTGAGYDLAAGIYRLALAQYFLGSLPAAAETARRLIAIGEKLGFEICDHAGLRVWGLASFGRCPEPRRPEQAGVSGNPAVELLWARGVWLLGQRRYLEAAECLEQALKILGHPRELMHTTLLPGWLAQALRLAAEALPPQAGRQRRDLLRRARRAVRFAVKLSRTWKNGLPQALRESALLSARRGHTHRPRRLLDESLAFAEERGMRLEEALTRVELGRVGRALGWADAEEQLAQGRRLLSELGARIPWLGLEVPEPPEDSRPPVTLSLADRFSTLLKLGRSISTELEPEAVYAATVKAAKELLRAEETLMLDRGLQPLMGSPDPDFSRSLVLAAVDQGKPRVLEEGLPQSTTDSAVLTGLRSALAVPVRVRGEVVACLYAAHRRVGGFFADEEVRLGRFLGALAGAALENCRTLAALAQADQELRTREARFRALFEGVGVGIALLDGVGRVVDANPVLREMLEWDRTPPQGLLFANSVYSADQPEFVQSFRTLVDEAGPAVASRLELRYVGRGGNFFAGQFTLAPVHRPQGGCEFVILSLSDISYRKLGQVVAFQETERRLLSTELHDVISQPVVGLYYLLQAVELLLERDPERAPAQAAEARGAVEVVLAELQALMFNLRTPVTDGLELREGVRTYLDRFRKDTGLEVEASLSGELDQVTGLPAIFAYRIVQEGLTNVRRHAQATRVKVALELADARLRGSLQDDGQGFEVSVDRPVDRHFGLRGMRERAELLGGVLEIVSAHGAGTTVRFELPVGDS